MDFGLTELLLIIAEEAAGAQACVCVCRNANSHMEADHRALCLSS